MSAPDGKLDNLSELPGAGNEPPPCDTHAGARRFLTDPMQRPDHSGAVLGETVRLGSELWRRSRGFTT